MFWLMIAPFLCTFFNVINYCELNCSQIENSTDYRCSGRLSVWKGMLERRTTTHQSDKPNSICLIEHPRFARNYSLYYKVTNPETAARTVPKTAVKDCDEL